jgi:hypothetical protein
MEHSEDSEHPRNNTDKATSRGQNLSPMPVRVTVESLPPPQPPSDEQKAKEDRHERREKLRFRAELVVGFFVVLYTIVTICLWRATNHANEVAGKSVENADRNFRQDERAWMGFRFMEGSITLTLNTSFLIPTELINTGKTPAKNVHGNIVVGVFKKGEPLDFTYSPGYAHYGVAAGTIFPGGKIVESFEGIKHGHERAESIIFTPAMKADLFSARSFIVVHGRIEYNDIFGKDHWTTYCRYVLHPELISDECTRYNDTDDNK